MTGTLIGTILLWLVVAVVVIAVVVWLLNWLYHRSTKETAFVRTGLGGEKVVIDGGALVLPIVHEVTPVSMRVSRLRVVREKADAIITRDRMRVDVDADFFVRVRPTREGVGAAAATLGDRLTSRDGLADLLEGKFVSALRSSAAEMALDEMHERRAEYVGRVAERASEVLAPNGLELESVAITDLDQTELEYFNPANRFDAEGLTQLITMVEDRRKARNDVEQASLVAIRARNLEAERETLEIERASEAARLDQQRDIETLRAEQAAEVARSRVEQEAAAAAARIASEEATSAREIARRRAVEAAEIAARDEVERARIAQERAVDLARIERQRAVREQEIAERAAVDEAEIRAERETRAARIAAEEEIEAREVSRAKALEEARIASQEAVEAARIAQESAVERAAIERDKLVRSLRIGEQQATSEAEIASREEIERARLATERSLEEARILLDRDTRKLGLERARILEIAEIEKDLEILRKRAEESLQRVETEEARARAEAAEESVATSRETEAARRIAAIDRILAEKEADLTRIAAEAEKIRAVVAAEAETLLNDADNMLSHEARTGRLRAKMLDRIEGIVRESVRPLEKIDGIKIVQMDGIAGGGGQGARSPTDEVIESALRFRAQAPLIDELMKEIGVENAGVAKMGDIFRSAKDAASIAKDTGAGGKKAAE